ncbi:MAG TPA: SpoIIE family protein phosphatase, partial [Limnobacter sp.]|nr:SpoIIE family protein phosphatase [Limnobacter sp.]
DQSDTNSYHQRVRNPNEILAELNARFQMNAEGDSYISILLGMFSLTTGELKFSIAGTPRLAHQNNAGELRLMGEAELPVGVSADVSYPLQQLTLQPGERIFVFSDGLTQVLDQEDAPLGLDGVLSLIESHQRETLHTQLRHLRQGVVHWSSGRDDQQVRNDDCTALAIQWKTPEAHDDDEPTSPPTAATPEAEDAPPPEPPGAAGDNNAPLNQFVFARRKENSRVLLLNDAQASPNLPQWLGEWGYQLHQTNTLKDCDDYLQQEYVAFFLIDLQSIPPQLEKTLSLARQHGRNPSVYVLIIANHGNGAELLRAIQWGADNFTQLAYSAQEIYVRLASGLRLAMVHKQFGQEKERIDHLHEEIEEDVRRVAQMQQSNLPKRATYDDLLHVYAHFRPATPISNQFMNVIELADGHLGFFHISAQGSGLVGVARGMTLHRRLTEAAQQSHTPLSNHLTQGFSPGSVLREINSWVMDEEEDHGGVFSLCYGVINPQTGDARISHAGYPPAIVTRARGDVEKLGLFGPPLGVSADAVFQDVFFSLNPGDRLIVFSNSLNDHPDLAEDFVGAGERLFESSAQASFDDLPVFFDQQLPHRQEWSLSDDAENHEQAGSDVALMVFQYAEYTPLVLHAYDKPTLHCMELELQNLYAHRRLKFRQGCHAKLAARADLITDLSATLTQWLEHKLPNDERISNIQLCLFEAASNLCRHAAIDAEHGYEVRLFLQADQSLLMLLMDRGMSIPQDRLEDAKSHDFDFDMDDDEQIPLGGMGLALVHSLSSEFTVHQFYGMNYTSMWFDPPA